MSGRRVALLVLAGLVGVLGGELAGKAPGKGAKRVGPFRLKDPRDNRVVDLRDWKDRKAVVVVFLGTECPVNNAFVPVLAGLHKTYAPKGVEFVGVNSNAHDTPARVAEHARKYEIPFPVVKDPANKVADAFGAQRTPEAFVLDGSGRVRYCGRIDDQFGVGYKRPGKPTRRDLAEALDEVLAGKPVSVPSTTASGCRIARAARPKSEGAVTYAKHVSRVLQRNCQECHRPGQVAPMPLLTYDDAVSWAETIREVIEEGRMPPWYADPRHGKFKNDRTLSKEDRDTMLAWVKSGTPRGDEKDLPAPREFPEGWTIGKPDVVLRMPKPFDVPAEAPRGGVPYRYFEVETNFKEDRWVERAEAKPGSPEVVHHILIFIVPPGARFHPDGPSQVLCGTAPGEMPMVLEPGMAKKVPAGSKLVFQMHYTPSGNAQPDRSMVGLIFAKRPPRHQVFTRPVANRWFVGRWYGIPAGAGAFQVEARHTFREDVHLLSFMPHMHLRGKDFRCEAVYPGGKTEVLLSVPRYNFNWQSVYRCAEPGALPRGTKLRCVAHFDNSARNPHNPDPAREVYWGDQTWEEMMIGWVDLYVDRHKP